MSEGHAPFILGGSGFVGRHLTAYLSADGTSATGKEGFARLDATDGDALRRYLEHRRPEAVVNSAGLADVDAAEREPARADQLNRVIVANLARCQESLGFYLLQLSTDYVFDGSRGRYREDDPTHPLNEYGRSKLRAEEELRGRADTLVLRISAPFGPGYGTRKTQFFRFVIEALRSGKPVPALVDQRVTATYLPDLARAVQVALERRPSGLLHVGSDEPLSRFEFAQKVAQAIGADAALVRPVQRADMTQWVAPRPADTSLDVARSKALGLRYTPVATALRELVGSAPA